MLLKKFLFAHKSSEQKQAEIWKGINGIIVPNVSGSEFDAVEYIRIMLACNQLLQGLGTVMV